MVQNMGKYRSLAQNVLIPSKSKVLDYIVGEKPRLGASYYSAGIGYVATDMLFPEVVQIYL